VVHLSSADAPAKRLAYVAAHTLVVYESHPTDDPTDDTTDDPIDPENAQPEGTQTFLRGHRSAIRSVNASDDRSVVVTCESGEDAMVIVWDVDAARPKRCVEGQHARGIAAADVTPCGRWYATLENHAEDSGRGQAVRVWDLRDGTSEEPRFVGETPLDDHVDPQIAIRFNAKKSPRELVTNGKTSAVFFVVDDDEKDDEENARSAASGEESNDDEEEDRPDDEEDRPEPARARRKLESGFKKYRCYSPPVRCSDFKQKVGAFTRSAFVEDLCVTGTDDGDLVVWKVGGVPPGGAEAFEVERAMRLATDRRGLKMVEAHVAGAVTFLGTVELDANDASASRGGTQNNARIAYLVTGGSDGNVRFFDSDLRLVAWFDGLDAGAITGVSFVRRATFEPETKRRFSDDSASTGTSSVDDDRPGTVVARAFSAPDFVIATDASRIFEMTASDFERRGPREAVDRAKKKILLSGTVEPAVCFAAHPTEPVLFVCGALGRVWTWNYDTKKTIKVVDLCENGKRPKHRPTACCYRADGLGILVGTRGGELKALDADSLTETQAMRFTWNAVTRVTVSDDPSCAYAAASDKAGCVSLFRLLGPIVEPKDGRDSARAFDFVGKHLTHAEETPCVGLAFHSSADGENVELCSCGAEGRLARFDVAGSTAEDGVDVLEVSDVALGGEAAGGDARPTAMTFLANPARVGDARARPEASERGDSPGSSREALEPEDETSAILVVCDDHLKMRLVDCETLTCVGVKRAPSFGDAPVHFLVPLANPSGNFAAFACERDVVGIVRLPLDGDPRNAMGVIAHPGRILTLEASKCGSRVFALGADPAGGGDAELSGLTISVWTVRVDSGTFEESGSGRGRGFPARRNARKSSRMASLLEGGSRGAFVEEMRDCFTYARLRASGSAFPKFGPEESEPGRVPFESVPDLMRGLGFYVTQREIDDVFVELRREAEAEVAAIAENCGGSRARRTDLDFDRFLSLFVNRRPPRPVGFEDVREAFEIVLDGEGESVSRERLVEMLTTSGEAMSDDELAEIAAALRGPGATVRDLFPENVTAKHFAEDVLGFLPGEPTEE
jgi:WD40 repeat protein/Ca2+-binding EF-hand superfamily protein